MKISTRFYWCTGCGRWHERRGGMRAHFAMYVPMEEPSESNFDGSLEDLERFVIARQLMREDAEALEKRIDARLSR